jgi:hypothetical protein
MKRICWSRSFSQDANRVPNTTSHKHIFPNMITWICELHCLQAVLQAVASWDDQVDHDEEDDAL